MSNALLLRKTELRKPSIMKNAKKEELKHFGTDLEFLPGAK